MAEKVWIETTYNNGVIITIPFDSFELFELVAKLHGSNDIQMIKIYKLKVLKF